MESVSGSIKNQSNADSLLLYAVSHSPLLPVYIQHKRDGSRTISTLNMELVTAPEGTFFWQTFKMWLTLLDNMYFPPQRIHFLMSFCDCFVALET